MEVTIVLRKEVADQAEAQLLYDKVKEKAEEIPGAKITGHTSNHFAQEEIPK